MITDQLAPWQQISTKSNSFFSICYEQLAQFLGRSDAALIVHRFHYWLQNEHSGYLLRDGCKWIYNGYKEWAEQFTWLTHTQIGRIIRKLEAIDWVISDRFYNLKRNVGFIGKCPNLHEDNQRKWYTLNYQKIYEDTGFDLLSVGSPNEATKELAKLKKLKRLYPTNVQNYRLQSTPVQEAMCNSEESSIYKENQKISQNTTSVVLRENTEVQEQPVASISIPQGEPELIDSCCADEEKENLLIQMKDSSQEQLPPAAVELPRKNQLKVMGVKLNDVRLLSAANFYQKNLVDAVDAFLEYCKIKQVQNPTRCLITAIEKGWKPEQPINSSNNLVDAVQKRGIIKKVFRTGWIAEQPAIIYLSEISGSDTFNVSLPHSNKEYYG